MKKAALTEEKILEHVLCNSYKEGMVDFMHQHPEYFKELVKLALGDKQPYSWRAAWVLWSYVEPNDKRIRNYIPQFIDALPDRIDGQQREYLMLLQRMELSEAVEGKLFDSCMEIWCVLTKNPSLRVNALKVMVGIAKKHPELFNEIKALTDPYYLENMSVPFKKSIARILHSANKVKRGKAAL